jgi:hypothetical protein
LPALLHQKGRKFLRATLKRQKLGHKSPLILDIALVAVNFIPPDFIWLPMRAKAQISLPNLR